MAETTAIRLIKDWRGRKAGHAMPYVPTGQANLMVKRGFAEYDIDDKIKKRKPRKPRKRAAKSE